MVISINQLLNSTNILGSAVTTYIYSYRMQCGLATDKMLSDTAQKSTWAKYVKHFCVKLSELFLLAPFPVLVLKRGWYWAATRLLYQIRLLSVALVIFLGYLLFFRGSSTFPSFCHFIRNSLALLLSRKEQELEARSPKTVNNNKQRPWHSFFRFWIKTNLE